MFIASAGPGLMSEGGKGPFDEGFATYEQRHPANRGSVLRAMFDSDYTLEERDGVMALHHMHPVFFIIASQLPRVAPHLPPTVKM